MKHMYIFATVALGAFLAMPAAAHHMSTDPDFVEEHVPDNALDQHNAVVDEVLDMGVAQMAGAVPGQSSMSGSEMDPADMGDYSGPVNATDPNAPRSPPVLTPY
jgi:hypothetical protein